MLALGLGLIFALAVSSAHAWGQSGHQVVAGIAQNLLTRDAAAKVKSILPDNQDLRCVSVWERRTQGARGFHGS